MNTYRTLGPLGLIVLLFGLIAGFVSGDWSSVYVLVHLIVGSMMLGLYLFTQIETLRESVGGRRSKYGTNAIVYTIMTVAVVVIVNYLATQHPVRWDLTEQGVFSLAPQSRQVLENLDVDVVARAFYREGEEGTGRDLLDGFGAESDRFEYEFIDPDKRPELAEQYEITQYNTVHLTAGDQSAKLTELSEQEITNTLIRLSSEGRKLAYYVVGHGEPALDDPTGELAYGQAKAAMENEGYDVSPLVLGSVPDVPGDAALLILAGPQRALLEREIVTLDRYLQRGGHALLMIDPQQGSELSGLLDERGIAIGNNIVVEEFVQLFAGATLGLEPIVDNYGTHEITAGFSERTIFRMARSVTPHQDLPEGLQVTELVRTSAKSWAETNLERLFDSGEVEQNDADTVGPVALAVAATIDRSALQWTAPLSASAVSDEAAPAADESVPGSEETPAGLEGRLVVFGDSVWLSNRYINNYFNQDLFLNTIGWLAGEEELISIRPRQTRASQVMLTSNESQVVFYVTVLLLPELILFCGMLVWLRRRYR